MKRWKALIAMLMCIALAMPAGLAATGDAILARRDYNTGEGFDDYINYTLAVGDTLVLIGGNGVYTWKPGDADLTANPWDDEHMEGLYSYNSEEDEDGEMVHTSSQALAAYSDGEDVYLVVGLQTMIESDGYYTFEGASLSKLVIEDGRTRVEPVEDSEIDWEEMVEYYEDESYPRNVEKCVWMDGVLYAVAYGTSDMQAFAIPTDGGYSEVLEDVPAPRAISKYKDGKLLFMTYDYNDGESVRFVAWDPQEEELEEVCSLETEMYVWPSGVVYSEESDRIYFTLGGSVVELDPATGETEEVNDMPANSGSGSALMLPGGYYVSAGYDATVVRNTDPSQKAEYSLKVNNGNYADPINAAYYDFSNIRGDVSVAVSTEYMQPSQIIEGMMNQSADWDIIVVSTSDEAFSSIFSRGYMAELKGSEKIDQLFADMYPSIAENLSYDGVPVAVPLTCYGNSFGVNVTALEKAGMTIDEIPTNWYDLLDQLDEINAKLKDTGVSMFYDWYTARDMKNQLFSMIFEDYASYMTMTDMTMGFNTDTLRSVLSKLDEIDFVEMGFPEEYEEEDMVYAMDSDEILFETYVGTTIGEFYGSYQPLLLSLTPDTEPVLKLQVSVAFVNPYSKNQEIAIEYLECAIDNMQFAQKASLCDIEVEPVRSSYYEEALENANEQMAMLQEALEEAEEEDRQMIEESIKDNERWLESIEDGYWDIRPEAIEWYRSNDDNITLQGYNVLYSGDNYSEVSEYIMQYYEGEIGAEEMLAGIDKKLQMMLLEGN